MALTTRRIAPDSDPKLKKAQVLNPYHSGDEFRRISSDRFIDEVTLKSAAAISRGRVPAWGARSEARGRLGGGGGRAPTPERQHRAPTTP